MYAQRTKYFLSSVLYKEYSDDNLLGERYHVKTSYLKYLNFNDNVSYSKTCLKRPLKKKTKIGFQDQLSLYAGQKYCRMLQGEHSAILSTFIKLPFAIKTFGLSCFEWPVKIDFTVISTFYH